MDVEVSGHEIERSVRQLHPLPGVDLSPILPTTAARQPTLTAAPANRKLT
jgi:hypothetical protein